MILQPLQERWKRLTPETRLYQRPYPIIALTGGIGSGKSSIARFLAHKAVPVISADVLVKNIYTLPETRVWLAENHGDVLNPDDGSPNFLKLREKAFHDEKTRLQLESWIYPRLPASFEMAEAPFKPVPWLVYEIPLLFERKMEKFFDVVIVSWTSRDTQKSRAMARDEISDNLIESILNQQMDIDLKRDRADLVFDNSISRNEAELTVALESLWRELVVQDR